MFEHELESVRAKAGALKAEMMAVAINDETKAASELIDQGVGKFEAFLVTRADKTVQEKAGGPKVSGDAGVVADDSDTKSEEDRKAAAPPKKAK